MTIKFGTDGWRGIIGWDFTADRVRACAQGVAQYLKQAGQAAAGLVVGYDTRFASEDFAAEVAKVVAGNGIRVFLCDRAAATPVVSYDVIHRRAGGAVIITASHNPPQWNGFKYKPEYAGSASVEVVEALEREIARVLGREQPDLSLAEAEGKGLVTETDAVTPYLAHIDRLLDLSSIRQSGLRVAVDAMHGAGAGYLPQLLGGGRTSVDELRSERNPIFPGMKQPEPVAHNLGSLSEHVVADNCDVGIALDGDADRVGIIDEHGRYLSTLETFALLCLYLLQTRQARGPLVKSITMTSMIYRLGELFGVPVHETPVGFKYLGPVMRQTDALAAGEESGGYAFRGHIPERDGILSGLFLLDMMVKTGKRPSELVRYLSSTVGPHHFNRWDISFEPGQRGAVVARLDSGKPSTLANKRVVRRDEPDGTRFSLEDGAWTLIRFSGTEPLLRVYAEAGSPEEVQKLLTEARDLAGV